MSPDKNTTEPQNLDGRTLDHRQRELDSVVDKCKKFYANATLKTKSFKSSLTAAVLQRTGDRVNQRTSSAPQAESPSKPRRSAGVESRQPDTRPIGRQQ